MASGNFGLARPVNRAILLSQNPAALRLPPCSPKRNTLTDSQKNFEVKDETESVRASFFFTLKFDAAGKWEIVRTWEVPPKGVDGLNAEERKEINRIENEDRELRSK